MAVYRNIQISFWQDPFVLDLTPEEKYFYIYLMTNSKTTQCGIYQVSKKIICLETGYNLETVEKLIDRFQDYGKIEYCSEHNEIFLQNWIKHNPVNNSNIRKCVTKELEKVKSQELVRNFEETNKGLIRDLQHPTKKKEKEKEKEEEKEEEEVIAPSSEPSEKLKDEIHKLANTCNIKKLTLHDLDRLFSYIGLVDKEVIEAAIKKGERKHVNYALTILDDMYKEGIIKKEHLFQKLAPGKQNIRKDTLPSYISDQTEQEKIQKVETPEEEEARQKHIKEMMIELGEWNEDKN